MKKQKVTARDVARESGVSPSTVSMILNNYKHIKFSEETKNRVLATCERLGYHPMGNGQLNSVAGRVLLVACPSLQNPHYINGIRGVQQRARELGYETIIFCTQRSEEEEANMVRMCRELHVAGVLLLYQPDNTTAYRQLNMENLVVQLYDKSEKMDMTVLELDNTKIGHIIAEHLLSLGHRKIAHVSLPLIETQPSRQRRVDGMKHCLKAHGLDPETHLQVCTLDAEKTRGRRKIEGRETGYLIASQLLEMGTDVTAFSATNDMVAYGIMDAIWERGKRIPQDYSVCGCDNLPDSSLRKLSLTSVETYMVEKGRDAVDLLIQKIEANSTLDLERRDYIRVTRIEYAPQLIVRKSTGKCPN